MNLRIDVDVLGPVDYQRIYKEIFIYIQTIMHHLSITVRHSSVKFRSDIMAVKFFRLSFGFDNTCHMLLFYEIASRKYFFII